MCHIKTYKNIIYRSVPSTHSAARFWRGFVGEVATAAGAKPAEEEQPDSEYHLTVDDCILPSGYCVPHRGGVGESWYQEDEEEEPW